LWEEGRRRLAAAAVESPLREAGLLLASLLRVSEAKLWSLEEVEIDRQLAERFELLLARRAQGEPFAYLIGEREFFGRLFAVDARVLIPRPETEHLVECALNLPLPRRCRVVDVGTGSGAIGITLALERPDWEVWATDRSLGSLAVARENQERYRLQGRFHLLATQWLSGLQLESFQLIVSNPPYVDPREFPTLSESVRNFEPREALVSEPAWFSSSVEILEQTLGLPPRSWVLLEVAGDRVEELARRVERFRWLEFVASERDLSGRERVGIWRRRDGR
jgi:release factor glutamine methyltransferase